MSISSRDRPSATVPLRKTRPVCLESSCRPSHAVSQCVFPIFIVWFSAFLQGLAAVHGLLCTIPWHKLPLLSTEFRLQKTCSVYVSVYLISSSDLGHSDTGEFWSFDLTRQDVAVKVECEIILGFFALLGANWSKEMWQRPSPEITGNIVHCPHKHAWHKALMMERLLQERLVHTLICLKWAGEVSEGFEMQHRERSRSKLPLRLPPPKKKWHGITSWDFCNLV